jgi:hypothetical protein
MDLQKTVSDELEKIIKSGFVENKIKATLEGTLKSIIEESLRSWSDFGKSLSEKLSESFCIDLSNMSIPEYGSRMLSYITDEIDLLMKNETEKILKSRIKEFFKPLEKDEYKVSEIVELYKEDIKSEFANDCDFVDETHEITAFVIGGLSDGYYDLLLDKDSEKREFLCQYRVRINEDGIWHISGTGGELHKTKHSILNSFERTLFTMFSQKVKIINDSEDIDNYIYSDYD